jgi:hypothetical protein
VCLPLLDLAPEALEVVELTLLGREHVDDRVAQVEQNPAAVRMALHPSHRVTLGLRPFDDRVGNRSCLNPRAAGHDRERVREDRASAHIDSDEIFALFLERSVANDVD